MNRRNRRRFLRPQTAHLESRLLLSNVGVALDFNSEYNGSPVWVDVHNLFDGWGSESNPWVGSPPIPVNSNNYPLALPPPSPT